LSVNSRGLLDTVRLKSSKTHYSHRYTAPILALLNIYHTKHVHTTFYCAPKKSSMAFTHG